MSHICFLFVSFQILYCYQEEVKCGVKCDFRGITNKYILLVQKTDLPNLHCHKTLVPFFFLASFFHASFQRAGEKKDVAGISRLKNESGAVKVSVDHRKKIWKKHMEKLMNVENEWSNSINASKVEGAVRRIEVEEVRCAVCIE